MASGNYAKKHVPPRPTETRSEIPRRSTRHLEPAVTADLEEDEPRTEGLHVRASVTRALQILQPAETSRMTSQPARSNRVVDEYAPPPLARHKPWLTPLIICIVCGVIFSGILISAAMLQRPGEPQLVGYYGGKAYSIQVGGSLANTWQSNQPIKQKVPITPKTGPYSVLGKPTISADFINRVLASYNSPAAGKGQALYDLGVQYGIDPAFALAFFMHESTFGTQGEARVTMSLGNLRCIPNYPCVDQDRGGYAQMPSWEGGFKAWYALIRNLYVAQWGLNTVDQIIPRYAPTADNNDETAYINSLKHAIDTWHAGILRP
jgi:hypothetical protein